MIKDFGGRLRSIRTTHEVIDLLREDWEKLTEPEREVFLLALKEQLDPAFANPMEAEETGGPARILDMIAATEYKHPMVDIRTFIKDPYFLGNTCDNLYPKLLDDLVELFDGGYKEAILTGSIGYGKTFFASIAVARCLYEISCLKDPHKTFGLARDSNISFIALSVNEALAQKVVFENIATKLKASPYFSEHFPFEETKKEMRFPHHIWVAARSSTDTSALGLNVFGCIIDEGNFMKAPNSKGQAGADARWGAADHAQTLYDMIKRRMKSRFQKQGKLPGLMIIVSSKKTKDDFTAKRVRESKDDPEIYVMDYATWDVKPDEYFSAKKFQVLVGNEAMPSKILVPEEVAAMKAKLQDGMHVIDVPEDFRRDFENDLEGSLRDIAGVETVSISPYLPQRDKIVACLDANRRHPFDVAEWDQSKSGYINWDAFAHMATVRDGGQVFKAWQPRFYPGVTRHIHIDPSLNTDFTGIAMGCVTGYKHIERRNLETQETYTEPAPVIWIDFMLRIVPPVGGEIDYGKIRQLVYEFMSHGFNVGLVTMDQFQSASSLQKFAVKGITAEKLSVDKPMDAYDTLKSAIYEERVRYYSYEPLLEELRNIQHDRIKNKVDHPKKAGNGKRGTKDVADAVCGIVYTLTTRYRGAPMGLYRGISEIPDPLMEEQRAAVEEPDFMLPFMRG